jgi:hypothetical protein
MTYCQPCSDASHPRRVDAFTDWILQRVDELVALNQGLPLVVPLTVTFSLGSIRPDQILHEFERFYARLCRLVVNNYERPSKRHLLPFAVAFRDDPSTRPGKHRDRPSLFDVLSNHPSIAPHVHSLVVVHPGLADRFLEVVPSLEATWRRIPVRTSAHDAPTYANRTLHADVPFALRVRELMRVDHLGSRSLVRARIRKVVAYSAKLGRRRDVDDENDLFTVLPTGRPGRRCAHTDGSRQMASIKLPCEHMLSIAGHDAASLDALLAAVSSPSTPHASSPLTCCSLFVLMHGGPAICAKRGIDRSRKLGAGFGDGGGRRRSGFAAETYEPRCGQRSS